MFGYALSGKGLYGADAASHRRAADDRVQRTTATRSRFAAGDEPLELLLIGGVPLKEPVVRYGPFVMNTEDEIRQAVVDYQGGRMGAINH